MNRLLLLLLFALPLLTFSQTKKVPYELKKLKNNGNPAATLLGINADQIQSIRQPTDFSAHLKSATKNFTIIPNDIGVEFFPFHIFGEDDVKKEIFKNTLGVSLALEETRDSVLQYGVGVRFSVIKDKKSKRKSSNDGKLSLVEAYDQLTNNTFSQLNQKMDSADYQKQLKELSEQIERVNMLRFTFNTYKQKNEAFTADLITELTALQTEIEIEIPEEVTSNDSDLIFSMLDVIGNQLSLQKQQLNAEYNLHREGVFQDVYSKMVSDMIQNSPKGQLDFSTAYAWNTINNKAPDVQQNKFGVWAVYSKSLSLWFDGDKREGGDWEAQEIEGKNINNLSVLAIARYQYEDLQSDLVNENIETNMFDGGVKLEFNHSKFNAGGEFILRNYFEEYQDVDQTQNRWLLDLGYDLGNNTFLSLNYGHDFDANVLDGGNIITLLNFVKGFGNKRNAEAAK